MIQTLLVEAEVFSDTDAIVLGERVRYLRHRRVANL